MQTTKNTKLGKLTGDMGSDNEIRTTLLSRNITVDGRRTSVRLEPEMWSSLYDIAKRENCSIHDICTLISMRKNPKTSLTAAIRVFLMLYFRASSTEEGHARAGHGNFEFMRHRAGVAKPTKNAPISTAKSLKKVSDGSVSAYIRHG